jgi:hypothetical protein
VNQRRFYSLGITEQRHFFTFYGIVMKLARRLASRAHKIRRAAIKDQIRRGFLAERLEDRALMAADIYSAYHNYSTPADVDGDYTVTASDVLAIINNINAHGSHTLPTSGTEGESSVKMVDVDADGEVTATDVIRVINFINAEGETGGNLPNKATYTLNVLGPTGQPLTGTPNISQDTDFYIQLSGKDNRSPGTDPITGKALARGIQAAGTDILFNTTFATPAANEQQTLLVLRDVSDPNSPPPTFTLTLPASAGHPGGTTAAISYVLNDPSGSPSLNTTATAAAIQSALNAALFNNSPTGTRVFFNGADGVFVVIFTGVNNQDLPLMTSSEDPTNLKVSEFLSGDASNILAAVQYETVSDGSPRYPVDHSASFVPTYGLNDIYGFTGATGLGTGTLPVFRVHMIANHLPSGTQQQQVTFTPDPLGSSDPATWDTFNPATGTGLFDNMQRPKHNTLVYGNDNVTDAAVNDAVNDPVAAATSSQFSGSATLSNLDNAYYGKTIVFTSGNLIGQERLISNYTGAAYEGATHTFHFATPFSQAPADGDTFTIKADTKEIEKSLVAYTPTNNEFFALNPVTINVVGSRYIATVDNASVNENTTVAGSVTNNSITVDVTANDQLVAGLAGTKEIKSADTVATSGVNTVGTVSIVSVGGVNTSLKFTPNANFNGTATFTYVAGVQGNNADQDKSTGTVTITVNPVNSAPTLTVPGAQTAAGENADVSLSGFTVADQDITEASGSHELAMTLTSSNGATLTLGSTTNLHTLAGNGSGSVTFTGTPADVQAALNTLAVSNPTQRGLISSVSVKADDQGQVGQVTADGTSVTKTISVTFPDVNDAPLNLVNSVNAEGAHVVAVPNSTNSPLSGFSVNDVDAGSGNLTVTLTAGAGTLSVTPGTGVSGNGTATLTITGTQTFVNTELSSLAYTPVALSTTATTLQFKTSDNGNTGATGGTQVTISNLTIDLDPGFRPGPIADAVSVNEGDTTPITIDVLNNDFTREKDGNATATTVIASVTQPAHGHVDITDAGGTVVASNGVKLKYTPEGGDFFTPGAPMTFTYTLADNVNDNKSATAAQATGTVSIRVNNTPDIVTTPDLFGTVIGGAVVGPDASRNVLSNDNVDKDNQQGDANFATLTVNTAANQSTTQGGKVTLLANGTFSYTPPSATFLGNDTFTYVAHETTKDNATGYDSQPVTVTIHVSSPPIAKNDHFDVLEQSASAQAKGSLLVDNGSGADTDPTENRTLHAELVSNVNLSGAGTVVINGDSTFTYTPEANQNFNTERPTANDIFFTYKAVASDGTPSNVATVFLSVKEVNDPPTAANDSFLAVKQNAQGTIGVNQTINVLKNDSILPDVAINGDEFLSVVGVSSTGAPGSFSSSASLGVGGSVKVEDGLVKYTSPTDIPPGGHVTFYYQISDNSSAGRQGGGPLFASASVDVNVVNFVPKTVSGTVYVDSNGDGQLTAGEKALSGITVHLTGVNISDDQVDLTATTDASGHYTFPEDPTVTLQPPKKGTSYTVTEDQPPFLVNGLDTYADLTPNNDTNTEADDHIGLLVTNSSRTDNAFLLTWSIADQSGNLTDLNFGEGGINTNPATGGLTNASGFKSELLASTGKNGFVAAVDLSGKILWSWTLEGDTGAWAGHSLLTAELAGDLATLDVSISGGSGITLTQGYYSSTSTARFRILGTGTANGQTMYIIRIDGSYDGSAGTFSGGMTDGMFAAANAHANTAGAEGEAPADANYAQSADAVFAQLAMA